ncbi:MAG TPA: enoyl-CoA hydratase/isomerase family protein, partial [Propionibacteriaceae bacterium]|nr:enoyl-CoA hydratase/isomerase family protein [Propionibacteriaceae bacterium]
MTTSDEVLAEVSEGVGRVVLNRPRAINALTPAMIDALLETLEGWADDDRVESVLLTGAGARGLCSGADVRALRELALAGDPGADAFFAREYRLNGVIASYPKPYEARMTGITMGGGLGVSAHGSHRVVDATSRLAMPETGIGLFPDVGMLWHLARAGALGAYMALTGSAVDGPTAVRAGLADVSDAEDTGRTVSGEDWVGECFSASSVAEILERLDGDWDTPEPSACAAVLRSRCPLSVAVTWEALQRAREMTSVEQVLAQDLTLATYLVHHADFAEGVRAQLVDKDRTPRWSHARLEDVTPAEVAEA